MTKKTEEIRKVIADAEAIIRKAKEDLLELECDGIQLKPSILQQDKIIYGEFDGSCMLAEDGKRYPVPANYSSKSNLIQGDGLKLTITGDGRFVYKQIKPQPQRRMIGVIAEDGHGDLVAYANEKFFKILDVSVTYFKLQIDDQVAMIVPRDREATWCAIESVISK